MFNMLLRSTLCFQNNSTKAITVLLIRRINQANMAELSTPRVNFLTFCVIHTVRLISTITDTSLKMLQLHITHQHTATTTPHSDKP